MSDDPTIREGQGRAPRAEPVADARYQPVREIARGGMGRVVEAFDTKLSRTVALKEILDEHPDARGRFMREVAITARLEHPSIVPLYDAGTSPDGSPFYVMRKVSGAPLDTLIRGATTLDQRLRLLPNVLALADAVAHAHVRGVIHRDLKPSNVLVGELGETVVIDWGLAKLIGDRDEPSPNERVASESLRTVAGTVFGTPGFMSPEQDAGEEVDERTDVYALGACLYYVLAGKPPLERAPLTSGVPPDLVTIVEKAMARERDARYLDAGGFGEDLRRFLGGQLVAAHHYPLHARIGRWLRRHRALVVVAALALVATVVVGAYSLRRVFAEQARAEAAARREHARADDLLLFKASSYLDSDATLAAATLQQLPADAARWPGLGAVVAGVRAGGVAYSYPGAATFTHVELAPGQRDERLLVSGIGFGHLIDLTTRTTTIVADDRSVSRLKWCGTQVIVYRRAGLNTLYDPVTRATKPAPWQGTAYECTPDGVAFVLHDARLSTFDLKTNEARAIATPISVSGITVSRSGKWLVAYGDEKALVMHAESGSFVVALPSFDASAATAAFAHDDSRVAISAAAGMVELDLTSSPPKERRRWNVPSRGFVHYIGTDLRWSLPSGPIERFEDDGPKFYSNHRGILPQVDLGESEATLVDERHVVVSARTGERHTLGVSAKVDVLHARRDGRFLVGGGEGRVLVWDLDEIVARRSVLASAAGVMFGGNQLYLFSEVPGGTALDRAHIRSDLVVEPAVRHVIRHLANVVAFEDAVVAIDRVNGRASIVEPEVHAIEGLDNTSVQRLDAAVLLVGTRAGKLRRIDRRGAELGELDDVGFPVIGLESRAGWILALSEDGVLWRRDPRGRITRSKFSEWVSPTLAPDGVAYLGRGREIHAWGTTGDPVLVATLPADPAWRSIRNVSANEVLVETKGGALYRIDRRTQEMRMLLASSQFIAVAPTGTAAALVDGGIRIVEPGGQSYRLAEQLPALAEGLAISQDGTHAVAIVGMDDRAVVHVWRLGVADPRAWIDHATNAVAPETADAAVVWR